MPIVPERSLLTKQIAKRLQPLLEELVRAMADQIEAEVLAHYRLMPRPMDPTKDVSRRRLKPELVTRTAPSIGAGKALRQMRVNLGVSQEALGAASGNPQTGISAMERGKMPVDQKCFEALGRIRDQDERRTA